MALSVVAARDELAATLATVSAAVPSDGPPPLAAELRWLLAGLASGYQRDDVVLANLQRWALTLGGPGQRRQSARDVAELIELVRIDVQRAAAALNEAARIDLDAADRVRPSQSAPQAATDRQDAHTERPDYRENER